MQGSNHFSESGGKKEKEKSNHSSHLWTNGTLTSWESHHTLSTLLARFSRETHFSIISLLPLNTEHNCWALFFCLSLKREPLTVCSPWLLYFHLYQVGHPFQMDPQDPPCPGPHVDQEGPLDPWERQIRNLYAKGYVGFSNLTMARKGKQLTGGPFAPDAPGAPDFPFGPWSIKNLWSTFLIWWHKGLHAPNNTEELHSYTFMSLLDHLWILSVLVVPLSQGFPEMIMAVWFDHCNFFLIGLFHTELKEGWV